MSNTVKTRRAKNRKSNGPSPGWVPESPTSPLLVVDDKSGEQPKPRLVMYDPMCRQIAETELVRYDAARLALQEAHTVDEAKDIRDKAAAMAAYARQASDGELQVWAAEIKLRAEHRAGQLLKDIEKAEGGRPTKTSNTQIPVSEAPPTLASLGVTKKQSSDWQVVAELSDEELQAAFDAGAKSGRPATTATLVRKVKAKEQKKKNAELKKEAQKLPKIERQYHCIVMDPPWPMTKIDRDVRQNQTDFPYPVMSEDELLEMHVPSADDCHMFLWTTHKFLPMALRLLSGWGFRYVCTFVWHKPGGFQPVGLPQYNCEFAIYSRKGTPRFIDTKKFFCCFNADRREHSRKPDVFYETIGRTCDAPRLDMFSREPRDGFEQHGNEPERFVDATAGEAVEAEDAEAAA